MPVALLPAVSGSVHGGPCREADLVGGASWEPLTGTVQYIQCRAVVNKQSVNSTAVSHFRVDVRRRREGRGGPSVEQPVYHYLYLYLYLYIYIL